MEEQTDVTQPMVVDLDRFTKMRKRFMKHYFLADCNPKFGGQETQIPWNTFSLAIHTFMSTYQLDARAVAIRFVYCYDEPQNQLYLRMQILTMTSVEGNPRQFTLNDSLCTWYEITNGTMTPTNDTDLFNVSYLENFYYCQSKKCSEETAENLADDTLVVKYARTATVPWLEMSALYTDNFSPSNATLCLASGCRCSKSIPDVKYVHTIISYLRTDEDVPLLDNKTGKLAFTNKAADMASLCPDKCGVYILPKSLVKGEDDDDENDDDDDE